MLKLIYEGKQLIQLLDLIKQSHFVVMDWDNSLPFQQEGFTFVLDSVDELPWLTKLPDGFLVFLAPSLRSSVNRSDYPRLRFREELESNLNWPQSLHLSGDIEVCLEFLSYILKQVPFCVGFRASGERLERLQAWRHGKHYRFFDQLQPANRQNLIIELDPTAEQVPQVHFWNGSPEGITLLKQEIGVLPSTLRLVSTAKVPRADRVRLPYVLTLPKLSPLRQRGFKRLLASLRETLD